MLLLTAVILLEPHGAGTKYTAIAIRGRRIVVDVLMRRRRQTGGPR